MENDNNMNHASKSSKDRPIIEVSSKQSPTKTKNVNVPVKPKESKNIK